MPLVPLLAFPFGGYHRNGNASNGTRGAAAAAAAAAQATWVAATGHAIGQAAAKAANRA